MLDGKPTITLRLSNNIEILVHKYYEFCNPY